jgi:hypothetical protein
MRTATLDKLIKEAISPPPPPAVCYGLLSRGLDIFLYYIWLDANMSFLDKFLPSISSRTGPVGIAINGLLMSVSSVDSAIHVTGKWKKEEQH